MDISQSNWSETDANNNVVAPDGWTSTTMTPIQIEPTGRAMMGAIKRWWNKANGAYTSTGAAGAFVVTPSNTADPPSLVNGEAWNFYAHQDSQGADTFQISNANGLPTKPLYVATQIGIIPILAKNIVAGQYCNVQYQSSLNGGGGGFLLTNPAQVSAGGNTAISSTGGTVALTATQAAVGSITISGALVSPLVVTVPNSKAWAWIINNLTTGGQTVTFENATPGTTFVLPAGLTIASTDGTNMVGPTAYAPLASPAFTGVPTAPTAALGTNTTQIATTAFVTQAAFATALPVQPGGTTPYVPVSTGGVVAWQAYSNDTANFLAGII